MQRLVIDSFTGANGLRLLGGFGVTLIVAVSVLVLGGALGVLLGWLRLSHQPVVRACLRVYLEVFRIVPTIALLFTAYYLLPQTVGLNLSGMSVAILVFTLWAAAEMSDIVRGALIAVPRHQREAGAALGLTDRQLFRCVLLPQSLPLVLPGTINLATRIIKTTSLLLMINVMDMVNVGQTLVEAAGHAHPAAAFWIYGVMAAGYYVLCSPLSHWAKHLERKEVATTNG